MTDKQRSFFKMRNLDLEARFSLCTHGTTRIPSPEGALELADGRIAKIDKNGLFQGWTIAEAEALKMAVERKVRKEIRATLSKPRRKKIKFS